MGDLPRLRRRVIEAGYPRLPPKVLAQGHRHGRIADEVRVGGHSGSEMLRQLDLQMIRPERQRLPANQERRG
jgi:hypothetical protein